MECYPSTAFFRRILWVSAAIYKFAITPLALSSAFVLYVLFAMTLFGYLDKNTYICNSNADIRII